MNDLVNIRLKESVATVRLTRPSALNALDRATLAALERALEQAAGEPGVRAIVLAGGPRAFCVGDDLKEAARLSPQALAEHINRLQGITRMLRDLPQPSVAAIAGYALGGGLELVLACDLRIAAVDARLACPEPAWGLSATGGSTVLLPRLIGDGWAREMLLFGRELDAGQAARVGLVSRVVPAGDLDAAAFEAASAAARLSPAAVAATKALLAADPARPFAEVLAEETSAVLGLFAGPDARAGLTAFAAGERPEFPGVAR